MTRELGNEGEPLMRTIPNRHAERRAVLFPPEVEARLGQFIGNCEKSSIFFLLILTLFTALPHFT